jgi:hypothetical protein
MALEVRQNLAAPPDSANRSATSWATSSPMALARLTARTAHDPCVSHPLDVADPSGPILVIQSNASTDISTSVIGMPRIKNCLRAMRVACFVPHHPSLLEAGFLYSARSPQSPLHRSYVAVRPTVDTMDAAEHLRRALHVYGTVTLVEKWSGTVGFGAAAMKQRSVVHLSGNDGRGDFPPDREAVSHLGTPFGCGQSVPARPKMR